MSDFLLDFRDADTRRKSAHRASSLLKFCDDTQVKVFERDCFTLVLTRVDDLSLWDPYQRASPKGDLLIALAGRIALDQSLWDVAGEMDEPGGLACKVIGKMYEEGGVDALAELNGNFMAFVYDAQAARFHLVTDRCGMYLGYWKEAAQDSLVYGSHPDVLASVLGESQDWDMTSLAEFLMTGRVTFPYTYYRNIRGLSPGCIYTFALKDRAVSCEAPRLYFHFGFKIDPKIAEWELAEDLAASFNKAVKRRTLALLGRVGVGLSGGLDSRALLSAAGVGEHIRAFTLFDVENSEFSVAKDVAAACGVQMIPIQRDAEYYGRTAELGTRISGGTGCITCNHYLGARERLNEIGIRNILTGCYCDYLLKGLALNTVETSISRLQKLADFQFEFYEPCAWFDVSSREAVLSRLKTTFPEAAKERLSEQDWLEVERKRTFPLAYEVDLAQRVIPQRVMPWYPPIVDNDIIDTYLRIPSRFKLNGSLFRKMLMILCPEKLCRIRDCNTGVAVNGSWPNQVLHRYSSLLRNRLGEKVLGRKPPTGSWPNWRHYFRDSKLIQSLWIRPNPAARELFIGVVGQHNYHEAVQDYLGADLALFIRLLTLKIWIDQRTL